MKKRTELEKKRERDREEKLRKEDREREDSIRKEELDKGERIRKEKEDKEERVKKEHDEKEERIKRELAVQRMSDEMNACWYKFDTIHRSFPIADLESVDDIRSKVEKASEYMAEYMFLIKKMESIDIKDDKDQDNLEKMSQFINEGNLRMKALRTKECNEKESKRLEEENIKVKKDEEAKLQKEKVHCVVNRLLAEIRLIENDFTKIKNISVSDLVDSELVDREKAIICFEYEISKLSSKITSLAEQMPPDFPNKETISHKYDSKEKEIRARFETYKKNILDEIRERNIGEDKSSKSSYEIKLDKFKGYESRSDIYTFQSEFEKCHLKNVKKNLLPDYLENNYLEGAALSLVKSIDSLDGIWSRLKEAYGDTELLLENKLHEIVNMGEIWKIKDKEKLVHALSKLKSIMLELQNLAAKHDIENELYYGGSIQKIYKVLGYGYTNKFIRKYCESKPSKKDCWGNLVAFIAKEVKFQEEIILNNRIFHEGSKLSFIKKKSYDEGDKRTYNSHIDKEKKLSCFLCGVADHAITVDHFGRKVIQYFSCKAFVDMTPKERFKLLLKKGLCYQCLAPGAPVEKGKHSDASCYNKFVCKNTSHNKYPRKLHVLLCEEHKNDASNMELLDKYKKENIYNLKTPVPQFSKQIKLSFVCNTRCKTEVVGNRLDPSEVVDSSVYILQTIVVENRKLNIFFDSGCGDLVSKKEAISKLEEVGKAGLVIPGPIALGGIGNLKTESSHGIYKVELTMADGNSAIMSGVCLDRVMLKFPMYPLNGKVQEDIVESYKSAGYDPKNLPKLPESVGGETDLIIGIKYLKYFPEVVFRLPSGLTIYESPFLSVDGTRGVVGGPHQVFTMIERHYCCDTFTSLGTYFVQQVMLARMGYQVNPDVELLCCKKEGVGDIYHETMEKMLNNEFYYKKPIKDCKRFEITENAGSEVTYRCNDCSDCKNCKKSEQIEFVSIQEEIEQDIINKSVVIDIEKRSVVARLPFIEDPLQNYFRIRIKLLQCIKVSLGN